MLLGKIKAANDCNRAFFCEFECVLDQVYNDLHEPSFVNAGTVRNSLSILHFQLKTFFLDKFCEYVLNFVKNFSDNLTFFDLLELIVFQGVNILHIIDQVKKQFALILDTFAVLRSAIDTNDDCVKLLELGHDGFDWVLHSLTHRCGYHVVEMRLGFSKLELEIFSPVSE